MLTREDSNSITRTVCVLQWTHWWGAVHTSGPSTCRQLIPQSGAIGPVCPWDGRDSHQPRCCQEGLPQYPGAEDKWLEEEMGGKNYSFCYLHAWIVDCRYMRWVLTLWPYSICSVSLLWVSHLAVACFEWCRVLCLIGNLHSHLASWSGTSSDKILY